MAVGQGLGCNKGYLFLNVLGRTARAHGPRIHFHPHSRGAAARQVHFAPAAGLGVVVLAGVAVVLPML